MFSRLHIFALALTASVVAIEGVAVVIAQSLGDVAKEEEARRKDVKSPSKVYTNRDLVSVPAPPAPETPKTSPAAGDDDKTADKAAASKDAAAKGPDGKVDGKGEGKDTVKDQAYWSGRLKELKTQLERDQAFAEALQSRINGLTTDFSARDDPAQRDVIGRDRQKALDELDRVRKAVVTDQKAVADFQEEARRASVPSGWLR